MTYGTHGKRTCDRCARCRKNNNSLLREALTLASEKTHKSAFTSILLPNRSLNAGEVVLPEYQVMPGQPGYIDLLSRKGMTLYPLKVSG
ncbi:hypothetical protein O9929_17020 [Vibrio lentus]|nr:hypothetical protein [Vibrio lentus]